MKIGIVCYASVGGSGVVATELALALAGRGHEVRLISSELPFRWRDGIPNLHFERVSTPAYPLFREPQYLLALASTIVRVACDHDLDIVHAHYAVPHATAAFLGEHILSSQIGDSGVRTVTTLHGTDITLVGADPSYRSVVAFSIEQSHGVTAVSESLRRNTIETLGIRRPICVIPNFLDCAHYRRRPNPALRSRLRSGDGPIIMHMSNFRPVKRAGVVFDVFERIRRTMPATLVFIGDGPDRAAIEARARSSEIAADVLFEGEQQDPVPLLSCADLFLLPSSQESFGMAALEAMACEVPVIAARVGGLPELIEDGTTGFLCAMDDADGMAACALEVLNNETLAKKVATAAAASVSQRFCVDRVVPLYEEHYQWVIGGGGNGGFTSLPAANPASASARPRS
ncbi:MAG TPA: N-acetyl-alpha-D-glucosaminyl L-malate synthase BshA [Vicinamibacterales bacterium]|nr:N-acetyl-alpha-D-glucosaminyl L-malate synthase BshA [Vicinamibacterales bacterium]